MSIRTTLRDLATATRMVAMGAKFAIVNWRPLVRTFRYRDEIPALAASAALCDNCPERGFCYRHEAALNRLHESIWVGEEPYALDTPAPVENGEGRPEEESLTPRRRVEDPEEDPEADQ